MSDFRKKIFLRLCLPMRILVLVLIILLSEDNSFRRFFGVSTLLVCFTFIYKYLKADMIGYFGGDAWWHENRLKHASIWGLTGILLLSGFEWAGFVLIADVLLGIVSYSLQA